MAAGKTDMERIGLFSELGYVSIGDSYPRVHLSFLPFNTPAYKNRQMLPGGSKERAATQAGYFDKEFKRVMEKEAYSNFVQLKRRFRIKEKEKDLGKAFVPNNPSKLGSGLGSYYGTFSGVVSAFSPLVHPREEYKAPGRNAMTNPGKKGTGYGYSNVLIGKVYEHSTDPYSAGRAVRIKEQERHKKRLQGGEFKLNLYPIDLFEKNPFYADRVPSASPSRKSSSAKLKGAQPFKPSSPGKRLGGCKAGAFTVYPSHSTDPYKVKKKEEPTRNKHGQIFKAASGGKTRPSDSVVNQNIMRSVNIDNFKTIKRVTGY